VDIVRGNAENLKFLRSFINTLDKVQQLVNLQIYLIDCIDRRVFFSRIAIDTKQSFQLQISILYCLKYFLYKNDTGKSMIIQTLLPLTENV
jgi:hypothetical protein